VSRLRIPVVHEARDWHAQVVVELPQAFLAELDLAGSLLDAAVTDSSENGQSHTIACKVAAPVAGEGARLDPPTAAMVHPKAWSQVEWGTRSGNRVEISALLLTTHLECPPEPSTAADDTLIRLAWGSIEWSRCLADWLTLTSGQLIGHRYRPALPNLDDAFVNAALVTPETVIPREWIANDRPY
jgi:hypothetical protein